MSLYLQFCKRYELLNHELYQVTIWVGGWGVGGQLQIFTSSNHESDNDFQEILLTLIIY